MRQGACCTQQAGRRQSTHRHARLHLRCEAETLRVRLSVASTVFVDEVLTHAGRTRLATAVAEYVLQLDEHPLAGHPERLPLRVIGDGITPRYHDAEAGQVTLHGRGSLHALTAALAHVEDSERRFCSNMAVEGRGAWEEHRWVGRTVRRGTVAFDVVRPKFRCLATHANPTTGERDVPMLTTLTTVFGQEKPTCAVAMVPSRAGGHMHVRRSRDAR